jgi:Endonuclease NucS
LGKYGLINLICFAIDSGIKMTSLFKVQNGQLVRAERRALTQERLIENWVADDPSLLGLNALIIGRQVTTDHGKFIDLLALDRSGGLVIIELKKDRTPRDIVAQILDYASWVKTLTTPGIYELSERYLSTRLAAAFQERFNERIPEQLNGTHSMLIVASELDPASRRIVEYLSEEHGVSINTAFFNVFSADGAEWLTTDFLLDQVAVEERSERKVRAPWSGFYFVNAGLGEHRSWNDMRRFGYVQAGGGTFYSGRLDQLSLGDQIFVYHKGAGYIGYGTVTSAKVLASQFETADGLLFEQALHGPAIKLRSTEPDLAEYVVGVDWNRTFDVEDARTFRGIFANQNVVCRLRDPATVDFLVEEFGVENVD